MLLCFTEISFHFHLLRSEQENLYVEYALKILRAHEQGDYSGILELHKSAENAENLRWAKKVLDLVLNDIRMLAVNVMMKRYLLYYM